MLGAVRVARRSLGGARKVLGRNLSVYSWGNGDDGQLGQPSIERQGLTNSYNEREPRLVESLEPQDVTSVGCGVKHSAAVTEDGRVLTWGKVTDSLLGHDGGNGSHCVHPHMVAEGLEGVKAKQVVCGDLHTVVLTEEGNVFTWGWGGSFMSGAGALGLGSMESKKRPEKVLFGGGDEVKLAKVATGKNHVMALGVSGEIWSWGRGENGRLGNGGNSDQLEPCPVDFFLDLDIVCKDIACGNSFTLALTDDGRIYGWGKNDQSQLGIGAGMAMDVYAMEDMPVQITALANEKIVKIAAGGGHALAINDKGELFFWGMRLWMEPHKMTALKEHHIAQAACGNGFSAVLTDAGQVFTWGKGIQVRQSGVLGHGDRSRHAQPELVGGFGAGVTISQVACGAKHAMAVTGLPSH